MGRKLLVWTFAVAASSLVALGILLAGEIAYRAWFNVPSRGAMVDAELFPYQPYVVSTQPPRLVLGHSDSLLEGYFGHSECDAKGGVTARFNRQGFRSPEFDALSPKKDNEVRILITGGSASISWNVGEKCTLNNNLQRALSERYPERRFRVFNIGSGAWVSMQELIAVQLYSHMIDPDIVIAFDGFNDIEHAYHMPINRAYSQWMIDLAFNRYVNWLESDVKELFEQFKIVKAAKELLRSREVRGQSVKSETAELPKLAVRPTPGGLATRIESTDVNVATIKKRTDFDPHNRNTVDAYVRNLTHMGKVLSTEDVKLLIALQPALYLKTPKSSKEKEIFWGYGHEINFVVQGYARASDSLAELADREENVGFMDLSNAFNGVNETILLDYCHMNAMGYAMLGEQLAERVAMSLEL